MTKQKKVNLVDEPEEPAPAEGREIVLPFSVKNRSFYSLCAAHLTRGRIVDYEGAAYYVEYARYDREDNQFVIGLSAAKT